MSLRPAAGSGIRVRTIATLAATVAITTAGLAFAPAADAATFLPLSSRLTAAAAQDDLTLQFSGGWLAVAGPATTVNDLRDDANLLGVANTVLYTGSNETGTAVLIFTGNDDSTSQPVGFNVAGDTIASVDNDTDQPWYIYDDNGTPDATVSAGAAQNITPANCVVIDADAYVQVDATVYV
jgi:hypothetical protein